MGNEDESGLEMLVKFPLTIKRIFYDGVLIEKHQREAAKRMGWKEKNLTIANALIFGLGTSAFFYFGGDYAGNIGGLEYIQNLQNSAVSFAADAVGITTKTLLYGHALFDGVQSVYRIGHSLTTGRSIASFSLMGAAGNALQYVLSSKKKEIKA